MKKLAIVTTHPIQYYAPIFKALTQNGINCKVFYTWGRGGVDDKFDPNFGKKITWDIPLLQGYEFEFCKNISTNPGSHHFRGIVNPNLKASIEEYEATHILIFGWSFKSHVQVMRYFKGKIPVWFRGDSNLLDQPKGFSAKTLIRKIFLTWIYRHIDIALYVGVANKAYYQQFSLKENQLVFAPHAVDNERFGTINNEQLEWIETTKRNANINTEDFAIVFCGKLEHKKNPLLLVNAVNDIANKKLHLFIVGNGILEKELEQAAKANTNIHIIPFQNQSMMPAVYRLGDFFCLPSQGPGETWGLAVNEAMACGKAILISDKCGCANDLVKDSINGYIFESNNVQALSNAIQQMTVSKDILNKMGNESLKIIESWSFKSITSSIQKILHK